MHFYARNQQEIALWTNPRSVLVSDALFARKVVRRISWIMRLRLLQGFEAFGHAWSPLDGLQIDLTYLKGFSTTEALNTCFIVPIPRNLL